MKKILILIGFALVLSAPSAALAEQEHHMGHEKHGAAAKSEKVKDPVCGMNISPNEAKFTQEYKGKKYSFCMKDCYEKFKAAPQKYIKK